MGRVEIKDGRIYVNGQAEQIISGAIHYFRVHPDLWDDRLDKAAAFGLNTVETYIPWNLHEPHPAEYCFSGIADIGAFIDKVKDHGLKLILRPGPYICSEWDNGGLPGWLMAIPGIEFRRMNKPYLDALTRYFDVLLPIIAEKTLPNGGPVIMVQLENEYGSFGNDKEYLRYIRDIYSRHNVDVPYFTGDGAGGHYILGGTLPDVQMALDFGSKPEKAFARGRMYRPEGPDFCMEFWGGWFDHWGEEHHIRKDAAPVLDEMLKSGANVNFYMFHGGTNFGFSNGANGNFGNEYEPTVTSYDFDAPVNECGDPTEKFYECQKVIAKYSKSGAVRTIEAVKKICPESAFFTGSVPLLQAVPCLASVSGHAVTPPTMEEIGENFGFVHYSTMLDGPIRKQDQEMGKIVLRLVDVHDFAMVWFDGEFIGTRWREDGSHPFELPDVPAQGARLDVLVENCGRINYGPKIGKDFKGVIGGVALELQYQFNWDYNMLPMNDLSGLDFSGFADVPVSFHCGYFDVQDIGEAFLRFPDRKSVV